MCAQRDVTMPPWRPSEEVRKNADLISQPEAAVMSGNDRAALLFET
jgi:hypothetical protein